MFLEALYSNLQPCDAHGKRLLHYHSLDSIELGLLTEWPSLGFAQRTLGKLGLGCGGRLVSYNKINQEGKGD